MTNQHLSSFKNLQPKGENSPLLEQRLKKKSKMVQQRDEELSHHRNAPFRNTQFRTKYPTRETIFNQIKINKALKMSKKAEERQSPPLFVEENYQSLDGWEKSLQSDTSRVIDNLQSKLNLHIQKKDSPIQRKLVKVKEFKVSPMPDEQDYFQVMERQIEVKAGQRNVSHTNVKKVKFEEKAQSVPEQETADLSGNGQLVDQRVSDYAPSIKIKSNANNIGMKRKARQPEMTMANFRNQMLNIDDIMQIVNHEQNDYIEPSDLK